MEPPVSQSTGGGRGHAALSSPDSRSNPALSAGECDTNGHWSFQRLSSQFVLTQSVDRYPSAHRARRESLQAACTVWGHGSSAEGGEG